MTYLKPLGIGAFGCVLVLGLAYGGLLWYQHTQMWAFFVSERILTARDLAPNGGPLQLLPGPTPQPTVKGKP